MSWKSTSVPVERRFSGGTDLITKRHSSLGRETIQTCMKYLGNGFEVWRTALKTLVNRILYKCKILCVLHRDLYNRMAYLYFPFFFIAFSSLSSLSLDLLSDEEWSLDNEQAMKTVLG
ncbi:hypothetical protein RhiirA4_481774 [Rhizophagus irregularis]|uniref:HAT C-terminal dimerisation domain-containing protein n=1 Tax=Rhizophagus irregularis TaxID=588596 RepID=A0A2I1HJZ4_9GLOM|nr:hypothetical protein RhiirA4_481774 [Rhizophagus irregularis]